MVPPMDKVSLPVPAGALLVIIALQVLQTRCNATRDIMLRVPHGHVRHALARAPRRCSARPHVSVVSVALSMSTSFNIQLYIDIYCFHV